MRTKRGKVSVHPTRIKTVALRVNPKVWRAVKAFAKAERHTIEELVETALVAHMREHSQ